MYSDGQVAKEEFVALVASWVVGCTIGAIPVAGGVLATIYDMAGYDDQVEQIVLDL